MSKLIKKIKPNEYLKLTSYAIKYSVSERKVYRYVNNDLVDNIKIDNVSFIKDIHFPVLERDNRAPIVNTLTLEHPIVNTLTLEDAQVPDFKEDSNVNTLTKDNVNTLTMKKRLKVLLEIPENDRSISNFEEIKEIKEKYNII